MRSTISTEIEAPPAVVFGIARGVERWGRLLPHYARSRVVERRADGSLVVDFVARRPIVGVLGLGLPVAWRARTWNEADTLRLRFVHVAGATKGMDVTWRIEPTSRGTRVSIDHVFEPRWLGFAAFVDRWFTRSIAGRTLATFKAIAEAVVQAVETAVEAPVDPGARALIKTTSPPVESDPLRATNPRV